MKRNIYVQFPAFFFNIGDIKTGTIVVHEKRKGFQKLSKCLQNIYLADIVIGKPLTNTELLLVSVVPECSDEI